MSTSKDRNLAPDRLRIGLVNNMREAALAATERHFASLVRAAAGEIPVQLSFFVLPEVARSEAEIRRMGCYYAPIADLWDSRFDALIVTGAEPSTAQLSDEPYWDSLASLIDWADRNTASSIWSCLAAHAAVLRLDGIARRPFAEKLLGVFACTKSPEGALAGRLTAGVPDLPSVPHSRWNDVSAVVEGVPADRSYRALTRSAECGADAFIRKGRSLFVCFQGHPEYEADTLLLEYRRDVRRFLAGLAPDYPVMPAGYFDAESVAILNRYRERTLSESPDNLLHEFPTSILAARVRNVWKTAAVALYRNWLSYLWEHRAWRTVVRPIGRIRPRSTRDYPSRVVAGEGIPD